MAVEINLDETEPEETQNEPSLISLRVALEANYTQHTSLIGQINLESDVLLPEIEAAREALYQTKEWKFLQQLEQQKSVLESNYEEHKKRAQEIMKQLKDLAE